MNAERHDLRWRQQSNADQPCRKLESPGLGALPIQEGTSAGEPNLERTEYALTIAGSQARRHRWVDSGQARVDLGAGPCRCPSAKLIAQIQRNLGHRRHTVQQRMEIEAS